MESICWIDARFAPLVLAPLVWLPWFALPFNCVMPALYLSVSIACIRHPGKTQGLGSLGKLDRLGKLGGSMQRPGIVCTLMRQRPGILTVSPGLRVGE